MVIFWMNLWMGNGTRKDSKEKDIELLIFGWFCECKIRHINIEKRERIVIYLQEFANGERDM